LPNPDIYIIIKEGALQTKITPVCRGPTSIHYTGNAGSEPHTKMKIRIIVLSSLYVFMIMLSYELIKELIFRESLTPWQSHWITIAFATVSSAAAALFSIDKITGIRKRDELVRLREEKLASIRQVIRVAQHHVNNQSNCLQIVRLELEGDGSLSEDTLLLLDQLVATSSARLNEISELEDPFDEEGLSIRL
jgi:hypothetical protein